MPVNLTSNAIPVILSGDMNSKPLLQVLDIKLIGSTQERYRLLLSDSVSTQQAMLATQLNDRVKSGDVRKGSIVQLIDYICSTIQNRKYKTDIEAASLHQEHTLPIMGPERLQEVGAYLTLDKMEEMVRPFAMPAEDFPPPSTPHGFTGYFKSAGMLERLVNLWPFHKHSNKQVE